MKSETLKNALNAHGWIGLIISLPLFVVFWAGAITLFHPELDQWFKQPYYDIDVDAKANGHAIDYNQLVEQQIQAFGILPEDRISLRLPNEKSPYLRMFFQVPVEKESDTLTLQTETAEDVAPQRIEKEFKDLLIDPYSGEIFTEHSPFELADFLYALHYNLHLPQGLYIVGLITLFFMVIIITGVVVQSKNLVKNFFLYRKDKNTRSQMNDMHNVIGVISLPYAAMYALSGVILNLLILVQIPSVLVLYKGDLDAVTRDAGFYTVNEKATGNTMQMPNLNTFVEQMELENAVEINGVNLFNFGDESAVIQFNGMRSEGFNESFSRFYQVSTQSYPAEMNLPEDNVFARGLLMLYSMHFANYAGTDMRLIYFVLAIAFCGMIVAGNVLWIVKRRRKNEYPKTLAFTRAITLGSCLGVITATAFTILLERTLPEAIVEREHLIEYAFGLVLLAATIAGFFINKLRQFVGLNLLLSAVFVALALVFEWLVLGSQILVQIENGYQVLGYTSVGLAICAAIVAWIGIKVLTYTPANNPEQHDGNIEMSMAK